MSDLQDKITAFLRSKPGGAFCDNCIHGELSAPVEKVAHETENMNNRAGFMKAEAICMRCSRYSLVTWAT